MSEYVYPTTFDASAKAEDYRLNHMNLSLSRRTWFHNYPFNKDLKIVITWGKDNYFLAYATWEGSVFFSDVDDFGWGRDMVKVCADDAVGRGHKQGSRHALVGDIRDNQAHAPILT